MKHVCVYISFLRQSACLLLLLLPDAHELEALPDVLAQILHLVDGLALPGVQVAGAAVREAPVGQGGEAVVLERA